MTQEQYNDLKTTIKLLAPHLRMLKAAYKEWQRNGYPWAGVQVSIDRRTTYWQYRSRHILICLVRGRTRKEIEWNFEDQRGTEYLEHLISKFCAPHGLIPDYDEKMRVIGVIPIEEKEALVKSVGA